MNAEQIQALLNGATKGPWEFALDRDADWVIKDANGSSFMGDTSYYPWQSENIKDARLIAAAPDLAQAALTAMAERDDARAELVAAITHYRGFERNTYEAGKAVSNDLTAENEALQALVAELAAGPSWTMVRLWASMVRDRGLKAEADIIMEAANEMEAALLSKGSPDADA